ncbi:hypothetical protein [Corallococcus sp. M7]
MMASLSDAASDFTLTCANPGPDRVYGFHVPGNAYVTAKASNASVALRSQCAVAKSELSCGAGGDWSDEAWGDLTEGTYFLVVSGTEDSEFTIQGTLASGAKCAQAPDWLQCEVGTYCLPTEGELRCREAACSDGENNDDGDEIEDYPRDPGCESPADDNEDDPPVTPECSNGIDDDGVNGKDWPRDPGCGSAGGRTEGGGTGESCEGPQVITAEYTPVALVGATRDEELSCGAPLPERVFGIYPPSAAFVTVNAPTASVEVRKWACGLGMTPYGSNGVCSAAAGSPDGGSFARQASEGGILDGGAPDGGVLDGGTPAGGIPGGTSLVAISQVQGLSDGGTPSRVSVRVNSNESFFILVSGAQDTTLHVVGLLNSKGICDPARDWFSCPGDETCAPDGAGYRCVEPPSLREEHRESREDSVRGALPASQGAKRPSGEPRDAGVSIPASAKSDESVDAPVPHVPRDEHAGALVMTDAGTLLASVMIGAGADLHSWWSWESGGAWRAMMAPVGGGAADRMDVWSCGSGDCVGASVRGSSGGGQ